ncbi:MAG TPA: MazG nucleotide pyrophosphohydrolase domain-containing protein [Acidimicrobiales bacterium]
MTSSVEPAAAAERGVPRVVVVGLGPAGPELCTAATLDAIARVPVRFARTSRHPSVSVLGDGYIAFDDLYEVAASFDEVYRNIVERLVAAAAEHDEVLYAVPGSPRVAERSVQLLAADPRVHTEVLPALSFLDLAWVRLGVDPLARGVRIVDGRSFTTDAAGATGPLMVAQCDARHVLSEIKLAVEEPPDAPVVVLQRLGLPDERQFEVAWDDLDRRIDPDHLTSLYVPELRTPVAAELVRFDEQVRILRAECPWDAEQTHASLRRHLLEETYEVLEAIDAVTAAEPHGGEALDDAYAHLEEELGDLLYQVFFHSVLAAENGRFTIADVARGIHDKLERRHPHVFGDLRVASSDDVRANWEQLKKAEKGRTSVMDGIPKGLPALAYASKVLGKAAGRLEPADAPSDDIGAELLRLVARARRAGVDAESALREAVTAFAQRFRELEAQDAPGGDGDAVPGAS